MAWTDRLRAAAYTSPSGVRTEFDYENVEQSVAKKTSNFEFPDADGTYIQDLGHAGRRYPLRIFISGTDYDLQANSFLEALLERGTGKLEHPNYGTVNVVPFGEIKRRDDLKTAANQAIFDVVFWDTIGLVYPTAQTDPISNITGSIVEYRTIVGGYLKSALTLTRFIQRFSFQKVFSNIFKLGRSSFTPLVSLSEAILRAFNASGDSIEFSLPVLVEQADVLAEQTVNFLRIPSRLEAATPVEYQEVYEVLITAITSATNAVADISEGQNAVNEFYTRDFFTGAYLVSAAEALISVRYETKTQAVLAAEELLNLLDAVVDWRDSNFNSLEIIDSGETYQKVLEVVSLAAGYLVDQSFDLKQERSVVLDRNRTIVDLVAELYGDIDQSLDFFINSNKLTGSEILEIPRGRQVVYYS